MLLFWLNRTKILFLLFLLFSWNWTSRDQTGRHHEKNGMILRKLITSVFLSVCSCLFFSQAKVLNLANDRRQWMAIGILSSAMVVLFVIIFALWSQNHDYWRQLKTNKNATFFNSIPFTQIIAITMQLVYLNFRKWIHENSSMYVPTHG